MPSLRRLLPLAPLVLFVACHAEGPAPADTPEVLLQRLHAAEQGGRYAELLDLVLPAQRPLVVWGTWFGAAYDSIGAPAEVAEAYAAILREHGLDEDWLNRRPTAEHDLNAIAAAALAGRDLGRLYQQLVGFDRARHPDQHLVGFAAVADTVAVEGDHAQVDAGGREYTFRREGGAWYWLMLPDAG